MDAHELREIQRPLKQMYRDDPASALIPASAAGWIDMRSLTCRIAERSEVVAAGLHPAAGGSGDDACSADLLLQALVGCAGVTFAAVATAMSVPIRKATVVADGFWDARGTLGVDREVSVGVTDITLRFDIDSDAEDQTLARLVELADRYCVVAQTLAHSTPVTVLYVRG
jgi:uncharacterized OsmC-like protein